MLQNKMQEKNMEENRKFLLIMKRTKITKKNKQPTKIIFLFQKAPTKSWRNIIILIGVEQKQSKKIQNCCNEEKNYR